MANTGDKEIEIQVQIGTSDKLIAFLKRSAKLIGEKHQVDTYFSPAHRDFLKARPVVEWLRIRDSSGKYSINYKNWHYDSQGRSQYCDEYETPVEDIDQVTKIFKALDIVKRVVVDKVRTLYLYQDYEIALDSVKGLGDFVEIEYKGGSTERDPAQITLEMVAFLKKVGCGKITRNYVGYPFQMLFPQEVKVEDQ